jgi:hypothetical protein
MGQCFTLVLSQAYRQVLMAYCNYADDEGENTYPSIERVAWMCDLSDRQVRRIVHGKNKEPGLIDIGLLEPLAYGKGGRGHSPLYRVNLSKGEMKPEYRRKIKTDIQMSSFTDQKADIPDVERRTSQARNPDITSVKADIQMSADPSLQPLLDPSCNPSVRSRPAKKQRDARTDHPAMRAFVEMRGRFPHKDLWDSVIETLGDKPDRAKLKECWRAWIGRGYKPDHLAWLFEWYVTGIPDRKETHSKSKVDHSMDNVRRAIEKKEAQLKNEKRVRAATGN